jgi:hypothetical protein
VDVPLTLPPGWSTRFAAARPDGAAATLGSCEKRRTYERLEPHSFQFIPFSVGSYGRLGKPAKLIALLGTLGMEAADKMHM